MAIKSAVSHATVLEIGLDLPEAAIADYEWIEPGKGYGEWLIPAKIINRGKIRIAVE
jgi:hypothetical protein